jgi:hypothetical protein
MVRLYMDVHVPEAISQALLLRGVDVLTAQEDGTTRLPDGGGVIYIHQLDLQIGRCVDDLEVIAKVSTSEEMANWVQYLPL